MTSYDREETFGLYLAVLKKGEPSPLLPESDEDPGVGGAAPGSGAGAREGIRRRRRPTAPAPAAAARRARRSPCRSISTACSSASLPVPGVPARAVLAAEGRRRRHGVLTSRRGGSGAAVPAAATRCTATA